MTLSVELTRSNKMPSGCSLEFTQKSIDELSAKASLEHENHCLSPEMQATPRK